MIIIDPNPDPGQNGLFRDIFICGYIQNITWHPSILHLLY